MPFAFHYSEMETDIFCDSPYLFEDRLKSISLKKQTSYSLPQPQYAVKKKRYVRPVTIHHWQLRDLVQLSPDGDIFHIQGNNVAKFSKRNNESSRFMGLDFEPICLALGYGFIATGGQGSELVVRSLRDPNVLFEMNILGGQINNSVFFSSPNSSLKENMEGNNGEIRLVQSNNDCTVRIFSLSHSASELNPITTLNYPVAMNSSAVSPDGKFMVAVGDSNEVFFHGSKEQGYKLLHTVSEASDSGFSCAWNRSSNHFAVASQDGLVCIWDIRSTKPLTKIVTPNKKACRVVKFSTDGAMDFLTFSEHSSFVHVVDARNYTSRQVIKVPTDVEKEDIAGLCFSHDCRQLYVGTTSSINEYDLNTLSRRTFTDGSII